jgi:SAM-dependent methyltransferase
MPRHAARSALFALTLFVSAALLFLVQPMVGKLLLPLLGGTPAVWNTCLVFFQSLLLAGYLYAHASTERLGVRRQARWHLLVLLVPPVALAAGWWLAGSPVPVVASLTPTDEDYPVFPLLAMLFLAAGPAFLVLATTGPLLQRWYAAEGGRDPYVLYAASNAGSLLGLLAYPFLVEPALSLTTQQLAWAAGVGVYVVLAVGCAVLSRRAGGDVGVSRRVYPGGPDGGDEPRRSLAPSRVARWLALSALTSALLCAGTTHLTTDMAPMPLLWVVPLALYLLSFILVFWRWPDVVHRAVGRLTPMLMIFLVLMLMTRATEPTALVVGLPLAAYFAILLVCHGELARDRPDREHLTAFYLAISLGSVLGSLACALVAPVLFHRLGLVEYPLALVLAALVRPGTPLARPRRGDLLAPLLLGLGTAALVLLVPRLLGPPPRFDSPDYLLDRMARAGLMFGAPAVAAFALVARPLRYALCLAALLLAASLDIGPNGAVLRTERNFFGTLRVTRSPDGRFVRLVHGTTQHGQQALESDDPLKPLMYYHPTGPAGRVMRMLPPERRRRVGAVGLGCGAMASYARPGEEWVFYEIDPAVIRIAQDTTYFTYLECCQGKLRVVPGDARRRLESEADASFDVLILDAFSSDAIPVHLLTREALELYLRKLRPGGVLLFHVSNRYLDLPPPLARLAEEEELFAYVDHDFATAGQEEEGKMRSTWMLLGGGAARGIAEKDRRWQAERPTPGPVWTDTFSNLLGVWKKLEE